MEFKNFENKLIIEKITNYCLENNISTQKINALTAKIKFGKLITPKNTRNTILLKTVKLFHFYY